MFKKALLPGLLMAATLTGFAQNSFAASPCVEIDQADDTLTPQEQKAALNTFESVLESQGFNHDACEVFQLTHSRLGEVITIKVVQGGESRTLRASSLSDLPAAYDQIVLSLLSGEPLKESVRRNNVMRSQARREKEAIDSLFFFGFSGSGAPQVERLMPGFHLSAQFETDAHAFGFSTGLMVGTGKNDGSVTTQVEEEAVRAFFGLDYAYFFSPLQSSSIYLGSGLGYEGTAVGGRTGDGFYLSPTVGMEFFRTSAARVGIELKTSLPLYEVGGEGLSTEWNPALSLILKIGWDVPPEWILFSLLAR